MYIYILRKLLPNNILVYIARILVDFDQNNWCEHEDSTPVEVPLHCWWHISQAWIDQYSSERSKDLSAGKIIDLPCLISAPGDILHHFVPHFWWKFRYFKKVRVL